jgi:hypothetical protein
MEVGGPSIWNQTNWLQVGLQEQVQINMAHLTSTKRGLWKKDLHRNKVLIMRRLFPHKKWATICTLFSLATYNGWKFHQMDVKTSFLNGDLKENVFMSQPKGFVVKGQEQKVCKLIKSLYGLK